MNNSGRNIKLDQVESIIDMDSLSRDSRFDVEAQGVRKCSNSIIGYLNMEQRWLTVSELKILDLRVRQIRMLKCKTCSFT